jgi:hypothetical protein
VGEGDALAAAGVLVELDEGEAVLEEPHAATEKAVRPTTANIALRCTCDEMTMVTPFLSDLSACLDHHVRSLRTWRGSPEVVGLKRICADS